MNNPRISFTFPFRWLTEEEFIKKLPENLERSVRQNQNINPMHPRLQDPLVHNYVVVLTQHSYKPKAYKMTAAQMTKALKKVFPTGTCAQLEKLFVQRMIKDAPPVMELQIFY